VTAQSHAIAPAVHEVTLGCGEIGVAAERQRLTFDAKMDRVV
jgi:hypothetical protein